MVMYFGKNKFLNHMLERGVRFSDASRRSGVARCHVTPLESSKYVKPREPTT